MRRLPSFLVLTSLALGLCPGVATAAAPAIPAPTTPIAARAAESAVATRTSYDTARELRTGVRSGLRIRRGALVLDQPTKLRGYRGTRYDTGTWTSPWATPAQSFTSLIASWSATTPGDSWVEVRARVRAGAATGRWQVLGRWAEGGRFVRRTSVPGQSDALGRVATDTWTSASATGASSQQLQVRLMRRAGASTATPAVAAVSAVTARTPGAVPPTSAPGPAAGTVLDVPTYSQMIHRGTFQQYGGGGEAWCSPTSLAMVLGHYGRLPAAQAYRWVGSRPDPWVAEVARRTYDTAYGGTGNWPFNTAYAAARGLDAHVTRLASLRDVEDLVVAGVPVIVSVSFGSGQLTGAPISATAGHLLVVVGFTASGDVVVNDPAGASDAEVRRTYSRAQLERAWLGGSGGTAYVVRPA